MDVARLITDLLVVLAAGLVSGAICRRLGVSLLVGYLLVGTIVGPGGLGLVEQPTHERESLAEAGALLLLFAVGIEFSLDELVRLSRFFLVGGALQMTLTTLPIVLVCRWFGMTWPAAVLSGAAASLSSTVLVFKSLAECGQTETRHGRRALGVLLFQDVALVPLLLMVPLLTGEGEAPSVASYAWLAGKSIVFVVSVLVAREVLSRWVVPELARLRSLELVVLFSVCLFGGTCFLTARLGLPAAVGALAAGLILSGTRLSHQIDTILVPFRETFSAVFFVSLGMLLRLDGVMKEPLLLLGGLVAMVAFKSLTATVALRATSLDWRSSLGMGIGLGQLGEFSFLLVGEAVRGGLVSDADRNRMMFIAIGTLALTPVLLRRGLRLTDRTFDDSPRDRSSLDRPTLDRPPDAARRALVIGVGTIGRRLATLLETQGCEVCLIDRSPVNLYPFAQQGFATVAGDARDVDVMQRADVAERHLAVVCVPNDDEARDIVRGMRQLHPTLAIVVRCRFESNVTQLKRAGASQVVSEETEAASRLLEMTGRLLED